MTIAFSIASLPGLLSLARIVVGNEFLVVPICSSLEAAAELEAANFFNLNIRDGLEVIFSDVVLCEAHSFIGSPNWDIGVLLIVLKMVKPNHRISIGTTLACFVQLKGNRRSVPTPHRKPDSVLTVLVRNVPEDAVAFIELLTLSLEILPELPPVRNFILEIEV